MPDTYHKPAPALAAAIKAISPIGPIGLIATPAILAALAAVVALHDDALVVARINLTRDQQLRVSATLSAARSILEHERTGETREPVRIAGDEVAS